MLFEVIVKHCCCNYDNTASSWFKAQCVSETLEMNLPYTKHALHCTSGMDMSLVVLLLLRCDCMKVRGEQEVGLCIPTVTKYDSTMLTTFKLSVQTGVLENSGVMSCTFLTCNNVGELHSGSAHTLYIYWEPVFTISVLLRICSRGTLYWNMTSINTANDSREVSIFKELHLVIGLASSIRKLDVVVLQFTYSFAHFVDYFAHSWFTYATQIACFTMEGSTCQKP